MSKKRGRSIGKSSTPKDSTIADPVDGSVADSNERPEPGVSHALLVPTKSDFFKKHEMSDADLQQLELSWEELSAICEHHLKQYSELENTADFIASRIRRHPAVHSVKARIKDPEHLLEKIIRKRRKNPQRLITLLTYEKEITDLIGIRVLHLFKGDWLPIHKFLKDVWGLAQSPIAYVRRGDPTEVEQVFERHGCNVREHAMGYRSVHYLIKSQPAKQIRVAELQVRTIFEEGWSEIDHRIRYPYKLDNEVLNQFLGVFNGLAGSADEMGTFIQTLRSQLALLESNRESDRVEHTKDIDALTLQISRLEIDSTEKKNLEKRVRELESHAPRSGGITIGGVIGNALATGRIGTVFTGTSFIAPSILSQNMAIGSTNIAARKCAKCGKQIPFGSLISSANCSDCDSRGRLTHD